MDKRIEKRINTICGDFLISEYLGKSRWKCVCQSCGEIRNLSTNSFSKRKVECKCTKSGVKIGDKYYRLTAKKRDLNRLNEGRVYWIWECDCGNLISASLNAVKGGNTKSCGCLNNEVRAKRLTQYNETINEDLSNQKFSKLTVIRLATEKECLGRPKGIRYWYCECDCGNHHIAGTSDLKKGKVSSCGCLNSKGEWKICQILESANISFAKQIKFSDLKTENNQYYSFDFGIIKNNKIIYLIEYDGIQHFSEKNQFKKDSNLYEQGIKRDKIKNDYCIKNNIPLIRIPYTHYDNLSLEDLLLDTSKFIFKRSDEENA